MMWGGATSKGANACNALERSLKDQKEKKVTEEKDGLATAYCQWFWRGAPSLSLPAGPVDGRQFVKPSLTSNMAGSGARGGAIAGCY